MVHVCVSVSVSRLRLRQRRVSFHVFVVAQTCSKQNKKKLISLFRSLCSFTKLYLLKKVLILILCYFSALSVFCCWRVLNNLCFSGFKKDLIQSKLDEKFFNGSRFFEVRKKRKKVKTKKSIKTFFSSKKWINFMFVWLLQPLEFFAEYFTFWRLQSELNLECQNAVNLFRLIICLLVY